jgi:hypothetical protein
MNSYWNHLGQELDDRGTAVLFPIEADTLTYGICDCHSSDVEDSGLSGRYAL